MSRRAGGDWGRGDGLVLLSLVGMAIVVFWRLALTDLIIGRGDVFFYFYPYRDFASAAARAGRVPLWNPYLFMGVPFLANSQAGFFYPLNLALAWWPVERMVNASIVIHAALAAIGAYLWGRGGLGLGRPGAWLTGLCYGLGGYFTAQVEHLNQVQVLAWLPWLLWLYELRLTNYTSRVASLALVIALQFLAGHMQSVFICLVGLASYALLPLVWDLVRQQTSLPPSPSGWRGLVRPFCVVVGATSLGGALAAVQLLPTFELSRLSIRGGGLPYKEAVSFSLRPGLVGRALLPSWGTPLFPEFVAYVGVVGLGLAGIGVLVGWFDGWPSRSPVERRGLSRRGTLVLATLGLFLALGGFNPAYFVLVKLVPGFGLFRAPARWLALYAVGMAGLAGIGLEGVVTAAEARTEKRALHWQGRRWWMGLIVPGAMLVGLILLGQLVGGESELDLAPPLELWSVVGWSVAALLFGTVLYYYVLRITHHASRIAHYVSRPSWSLTAVLVILVAAELLGASLFLPFNRATAPGALTSLRPAVAHLLAEASATNSGESLGRTDSAEGSTHCGAGELCRSLVANSERGLNRAATGPPARFLSISNIFFDPGDKPEIEIALGPQLSANAFYDYVIATKQKEVLIPNLPLYYRLPAMDGYDGGVLPLRHYVTLERLYMPEEQVAIDGRLRENLDTVPDGRWLSLFNVRFVITDKVGDAWFDGAFYDLQMDANLSAGDEVTVGYVPALAATALGVVYRADGAVEGTPLAELAVTMADGRRMSLSLLADATVAGDRVARLVWGQAGTPSEVGVRGVWGAGELMIRGLTLIDERTGAFQSLTLSDRGRYRLVHSGDVKIYENLDVLPRAFFVPQATVVPDDEAALATMRDPNFDPTTTIVLVDGVSASPQSPAPNPQSTRTELLLYEPEHVVATVSAPTSGWLLLGDAWYPGWEAMVDGQPVPVERADILFRAVAVPAGEHRVEWVYRPASFRLGAAISMGTLGLLLMGGGWVTLGRRRQAS